MVLIKIVKYYAGTWEPYKNGYAKHLKDSKAGCALLALLLLETQKVCAAAH